MNNPLFFGNLGAGEIIVIALIVLLLFGGKKIPELMKGLGKGIRSFKEGMNNIEKEIENMAKMYQMEADKLKELVGEEEKKQIALDMAVQKAVEFVVDAAVEK